MVASGKLGCSHVTKSHQAGELLKQSNSGTEREAKASQSCWGWEEACKGLLRAIEHWATVKLELSIETDEPSWGMQYFNPTKAREDMSGTSTGWGKRQHGSCWGNSPPMRTKGLAKAAEEKPWVERWQKHIRTMFPSVFAVTMMIKIITLYAQIVLVLQVIWRLRDG